MAVHFCISLLSDRHDCFQASEREIQHSDTTLQMARSRPRRNDQAVHRLDPDLRLTPLHASRHELVSGFDSSSEINILHRHRDRLERDHERVHGAAKVGTTLAPYTSWTSQAGLTSVKTYPNMAYTP